MKKKTTNNTSGNRKGYRATKNDDGLLYFTSYEKFAKISKSNLNMQDLNAKSKYRVCSKCGKTLSNREWKSRQCKCGAKFE